MASSSSGQRPSLLDLPYESQLQIIENVSTKTLFSLQLVSKRTHELASSRLYRSLTFFLSHPDAPQYYQESHYRLADALQTFATSDYNYAQHVKQFQVCISESETEDAQKRIASRYHVSEEPTMFLNMALLLMVKKACTMESFRWDVPVELGLDVYDVLSKLESLQCLHVRLDAMSVIRTRVVPCSTSVPLPPHVAQQILPQSYPPGSSSHPFPPSVVTTIAGPPKVVSTPQVGKSKLTRTRNGRRKFGKFRTLRDLQITAIENLDCLEEIQACLAGSSRTLRTFSLSLSSSLVQKARKRGTLTLVPPGPPANPVGAGIDDDDEAITEPETPPVINAQSNAGPSDADIKRERQAQEMTLARVFGSVQLAAKDKKLDKSLKESAKSVKLKEKEQQTGSGDLVKLQQQLQEYLKKNTGQADQREAQKLIKTINQQLAQTTSASPKKTKKKMETKAPEKGIPKKAKYSAGPWTTGGSTFHYTDPDDWGSIPPLPPVGSSSQSSTAKPSFMYQHGGKNGPNPASSETLKALFGPHASASMMEDALDEFQYMPPSSLQIGNHSHSTHPKPPPTSYSYGNPKYYTPSQPPQFGSNAYSNSHSGSVSPFPYSFEDVLNDSVLMDAQTVLSQIKKSLQDTDSYLQTPPSQAYSYQDLANMPGQNHAKFSSQHQTPEDLAVVESDSDDSSLNEELIKFGKTAGSSPTKQMGNGQMAEDDPDIEVDMEHPDVEGLSDVEIVEDQASPMSIAEDTKGFSSKEHGLLSEPSKLNLKENVPLPSQPSSANSTLMNDSKKLTQGNMLDGAFDSQNNFKDDLLQANTSTPEEIMQDYLRSKHGFRLEEFSLYLVPLKPSVIARALDMHCLRRLSLYSVGPQGGFWSLFEKSAGSGFGSKLESIRTDDVSNAFLQCVSRLSGLKELHLTRRSSKDFDSTTKKIPATIDEIRKLVLAKHLPTLESLALANHEDDKWDLNAKCLRLIAAKGKGLRELTCSMDTSNFHTFLQCLPGMRSLEAVNILTIRSHERLASLYKECKKVIVDVLHFCPELKLKYVAMASLVYQFSAAPKVSLSDWFSKQEQMLHSRSSKGKGKAVVRSGTVKTRQADEMDSEDLSDLDEPRPYVFVTKNLKFNEVPDHYAIFTPEVRKAKF